MKLSKKILSIATIVSIAILSLLLILLLFDNNIFGDSMLNIVITFASLGIGGFFAINSLNMIDKNKVLGWVSLGLIAGSVVLIIFGVWLDLAEGILLNITLSLGLLSILFNIIVSSGLSLGKSKMIWQVVVYIIVGITDLMATLAIFGAIDLGDVLPWFLSLIILSIVGVVVLKVLAKKSTGDSAPSIPANMISITKEEYAILQDKARKYDELMAKNGENTNV